MLQEDVLRGPPPRSRLLILYIPVLLACYSVVVAKTSKSVGLFVNK